MPRGSREEARSQLATTCVANCELGPGWGPQGPGGVTSPASSSRPVTSSRRDPHVPGISERSAISAVPYAPHRRIRNSPGSWPRGSHGERDEPLTSSPAKPCVLGASWGSQPARTPMRRPGRTDAHLGRPPAPRAPPVISPAHAARAAPYDRGATIAYDSEQWHDLFVVRRRRRRRGLGGAARAAGSSRAGASGGGARPALARRPLRAPGDRRCPLLAGRRHRLRDHRRHR